MRFSFFLCFLILIPSYLRGDEVRDFLTAVKKGQFSNVENMLEKNPRLINKKTDDLQHPLHIAVTHSHIHIVRTLIDQGANIEVRNKKRQTPLHLAVLNDDKEMIQTLLKYKSNPNAKDIKRQTPFHYVATRKMLNNNTVQYFLNHGANPTSKDLLGHTPVHHFILHNNISAIQMFFNRGFKLDIKDVTGVTPLHLASMIGNKKIVDVLIRSEVNLNVKDTKGQTPLDLSVIHNHEDIFFSLISAGAYLNVNKKINGSNLLHRAISHENQIIIQFLIEFGANPNIKDKNGNTPLHISQKEQITNFLLNHGADPYIQNKKRQTPLHVTESKVIAERLIDAGANPYLKDKRNFTAFDISSLTPDRKEVPLFLRSSDMENIFKEKQNFLKAVKDHHFHIAQKMLKENPHLVDKKDELGNTALHYFSKNNNLEMVQFLLNMKANPHIKNNLGRTPLHLTYDGSVALALLRAGALPNAFDHDWRTPLYFAKNVQLAEVLLDHGAWADVKDSHKQTPYKFLKTYGSTSVTRLLESKGIRSFHNSFFEATISKCINIFASL